MGVHPFCEMRFPNLVKRAGLIQDVYCGKVCDVTLIGDLEQRLKGSNDTGTYQLAWYSDAIFRAEYRENQSQFLISRAYIVRYIGLTRGF